MRLDEWQKYIDSQFLEDDQEPKSVPSKSTPKAEAKSISSSPPREDDSLSAAFNLQTLPAEPAEFTAQNNAAPDVQETDLLTPASPSEAAAFPFQPQSYQDTTNQVVTDITAVAAASIPQPVPGVEIEVNPSAEAAPTADAVLDTEMTASLSTLSRAETAPNAIQNVLTLVVATPTLSADRIAEMGPPLIELLTPLPEQTSLSQSQPEVNNRTRRRSQSATFPDPLASPDAASAITASPAATPPLAASQFSDRNLFQPVTDLDADIPDFERYMPTSYVLPQANMPADPPSSATHSLPAAGSEVVNAPNDSASTESAPEVISTDTLQLNLSALALSQTPASPSEQTVIILSETITTADAPELPFGSDQDALALSRRASKSRARHARNVRPENVPSGLSASELWAAVPRHVQTLLSLERMEEEEVAQFSYKRPFQEKRHELIERLLDPILSLEDTARLLNVCPTTVRRYTNKGILTYYRKEPQRSTRALSEEASGADKETRQRRFRLSDILAFLETQQTAIAADRQAERRTTSRADFNQDNSGNDN